MTKITKEKKMQKIKALSVIQVLIKLVKLNPPLDGFLDVHLLLNSISTMGTVYGARLLHGKNEIEVNILAPINEVRAYVDENGDYSVIMICINLLSLISEDNIPVTITSNIIGGTELIEEHIEFAQKVFEQCMD